MTSGDGACRADRSGAKITVVAAEQRDERCDERRPMQRRHARDRVERRAPHRGIVVREPSDQRLADGRCRDHRTAAAARTAAIGSASRATSRRSASGSAAHASHRRGDANGTVGALGVEGERRGDLLACTIRGDDGERLGAHRGIGIERDAVGELGREALEPPGRDRTDAEDPARGVWVSEEHRAAELRRDRDLAGHHPRRG